MKLLSCGIPSITFIEIYSIMSLLYFILQVLNLLFIQILVPRLFNITV